MASTRRLTPWVQAVYTLRFLIDGSRIKQLAVDNILLKSIAYEYLWEGLEVLAVCAPTLHDAIDTVRAAGDAHASLDGTLISANRIKAEGPTEGCDLCYLSKYPCHDTNFQIISVPDGFPLWIGEARPSHEHDSTAAPDRRRGRDRPAQHRCALEAILYRDKVSLSPLEDRHHHLRLPAFFRIERPRRPKNITQDA